MFLPQIQYSQIMEAICEEPTLEEQGEDAIDSTTGFVESIIDYGNYSDARANQKTSTKQSRTTRPGL